MFTKIEHALNNIIIVGAFLDIIIKALLKVLYLNEGPDYKSNY